MAQRPGTPRLLREINDRTALELLLHHGAMTRGQLVERTGLSKPTASQLLARLEALGLVTVTGTAAGARGPSAQVYAIEPTAGYAMGVAAVSELPIGGVDTEEDLARANARWLELSAERA